MAGDVFFSFPLFQVVVDGLGGLDGEVLAGDHVDVVVAQRQDFFKAVDGGLDGTPACPVDFCSFLDEMHPCFLAEVEDRGDVCLFIDMDEKVEAGMFQRTDQPFELPRVLMGEDQVCDFHGVQK
jgi:hypothetical protein